LARIVLLADDSVTAQNMGRRIMTDAGYEVITVNNGSAALKKIHEKRPDLIVLDVYMPGYGGLEVCQRLKESEATMKIPVLLTVGKMEPFKAEEAKRVHADGHIIKPFDASELLSALTKLEDKIVPQSENGRGSRAKSETKKRTLPTEDPAVSFDDGHTAQIEYLARAKQRRPADEVSETFDSPVAQPPINPAPAIDDSVATAEMPAVAETPSYEPAASTYEPPAATITPEERDGAVTFASGPIYEPEVIASARLAEEFEIQREVEVEQQPEPAAEISSASSVSDAPVHFDRDPLVEISTTETGAGHFEPGLVPKGAAIDFSPAPQAEPVRHWVAETVVPTSEEASHSLEEEMQQADAMNEPAPSDPHPSQDSAAERTSASENNWQPPAAPETESGAAFAAAASASDSFAQTNAISAINANSEPPTGSEPSAAWDNWRRIRDTVITEQATEAIAEAAPAIADAAVSSQNEVPTAPPAQDAAPASGSDALSNIVDSVLAELKPRLLAEIAKQLANDKK
jgi:CheY-like chemotaxis protein